MWYVYQTHFRNYATILSNLTIFCLVKSTMIGTDNKLYVYAVPGPENSTIPFETDFTILIIDSSGSYVEVNTSGVVRGFVIISY